MTMTLDVFASRVIKMKTEKTRKKTPTHTPAPTMGNSPHRRTVIEIPTANVTRPQMKIPIPAKIATTSLVFWSLLRGAEELVRHISLLDGSTT